MNLHITVLKQEAIQALNVRDDCWYIDATAGGGGHTGAILESGGKVLALDQDPEAIEVLQERFKGEDRCIVEHVSFKDLVHVTDKHSITHVEGVLFDLGMSSNQLETSERGFSFQKNGPLDMRMDPVFKVSAADLVNGLSARELQLLFQNYGEADYSKTIANAIVERRAVEPIKETEELRLIVEDAVGNVWDGIHPATQVFQALRIAVNDELEVLKESLSETVKLLAPEGRVVVISFHSLEDRIVKNFFKGNDMLHPLKDTLVTPSTDEIAVNPRARSAKMRVAEKLKK